MTDLFNMAKHIGYAFDERIGGYRDRATGQKVKTLTVLREAERYHDRYVRPNIESITDRFIEGKIDLPKWQAEMREELRQAWKHTATAGRGGREQMTQADYGRLGGRLSFEYRKLADFARQIEAGQLTEAQIRARAALYANGPRTAYFDGLTAAQREAGMTEERRILGVAEHCADCEYYASLGWQPLGSLPEPGTQCACGHNCKCTKEFRGSGERI